MSANPTRVDWDAPASDAGSPLREGNRVLESIAQQEALRALLAFSELHEQIRSRRVAAGNSVDGDLFETERFILDEVLQLICDRAQSITEADGVVVALAEEPRAEQSTPAISTPAISTAAIKKNDLLCRATAGPLIIERGSRLIGDSEFLRNCLESGRILRSDDCDDDTRVDLDLARKMGVRSTVLVPLRGQREQLGVLQAFSTSARAFTDHDVRCFDLFAELVLSALKPADEDRRIHWLAEVADEVLRPRAAATATEAVETAAALSSAPEPLLANAHPAPDLTPQAPAIVAASTTVELPGAGFADRVSETESEIYAETHETLPIEEPAPPTEPRRLPFLHRLSLAGSARPGLSVVIGLAAVAALFSAGAWWGMQLHGNTAAAGSEVAGMDATRNAISPRSVTVPRVPAEDVLSPAISDNLMSPPQAGSEAAPLTAVAQDKLAALPKVTGVRHWTSSMGSTVVIDMEDQVPYEVHRLMSPERIYFDLHDTVLAPDLDGKSMEVGDASLRRVRVAQPVAGITRVVLDTKDGSNFAVSMESSPYRLVVELRDSNQSLAARSFSSNGANPKSALTRTLASVSAPAPLAALPAKASDEAVPARTGKFRIVLDAGHGGWDLGTVGRQGLLEKDLVLDVTQRLGKLLQSRLGAEVMFTRSDDTYLPLDQRADIANRTQADLFISVHANYSSSAAARGVETYYTNLFSAPGSREVEKPEDGSLAKLTPVSLSARGLHDKIDESRRLAASVQRSLYATLAASSPDIRNRGTKDAAFAVLTGTTMPSILTEISFVSSPADERNLQTATYRQQIAEALYKGIARYQEASPRTKIAQLQRPSER